MTRGEWISDTDDHEDPRPRRAAPDLVVVGGGAAGFAASIRAADLGASVVLVERGILGGTCVNVGCVPSKAMIRAAEAAHRARGSAFVGVRTHLDAIDLGAVVRQKDELVTALRRTKYEDVLRAYPSIRRIAGDARLRPDGSLEVDGVPLPARKIVFATGSRSWAAPIAGLDAVPYLTSTEALALSTLPSRMIILGGSAVGLEIAQLYARMGTQVTILEAMPTLIPSEDVDVAAALATYLRDEGLDLRVGARVARVSGGPGAYRIEATIGGVPLLLEADQLLVATGRRASTAGLGLEEAGVRLGRKGEILVDNHLETTHPGIYAAGDVIGDPAFVYVAAYAGSVAAENAVRGNQRAYDLRVVPRVTFTDPAVASVGLTEAEARARDIEVAIATLPMAHVPRALAARDTRGFVKLVADADTKLLVGAHVLAPEAGEMLQPAAMMIRFGIRTDEVAAMLHAYLTNAEAIKLACQVFTTDVAKLSCCAS